MESKVYQIIWVQSGKSSFYFWNQFRILLYFNLQKSPHWELKLPPNLENHNIASITYKIAPIEYHWSRPLLTHVSLLSCPSVRRWLCSTRFLVSAHVTPRWMWLVALLVSARTLSYCHINMLLFKGCQPLVANCTPFFPISGQFLKSVVRDPVFT